MSIDLGYLTDISELVRNLPDFGIHGTSEDLLGRIMSEGRFFSGSYFRVEKPERELPIETYLGKLLNSVAMAMSQKGKAEYDFETGRLEFLVKPAFLLIRPKEGHSSVGHTKDDAESIGYRGVSGTGYPNSYGTFPWGSTHRYGTQDLVPVKFSDSDVARINTLLNADIQRLRPQLDVCPGKETSIGYCMIKALARVGAEKILETMQSQSH